MGKKLVIAEKPSVAADIARARGGLARRRDYFESDVYLLASAVGPLLEGAFPTGEARLSSVPVFTYHLPAFARPRKKTRLRGEAAGRGRHRARARWFRAQGRLLRE